LAAGRCAAASATSGSSSRGTPLAQAGGAGRRRELLDASDRVVCGERLREAGDLVRRDVRIEPQARRERDRVHRAVRQREAAAERLRHRVRHPHARSQRRPGVHRPAQELGAGGDVGAVGEHRREPLADQASAGERVAVGLLPVSLRVEGLGAVCERVQRRPGRLRSW
jgi:hypothetical protein